MDVIGWIAVTLVILAVAIAIFAGLALVVGWLLGGIVGRVDHEINGLVGRRYPHPAGWYVDPYRESEYRWWTGTQWTTRVADLEEMV